MLLLTSNATPNYNSNKTAVFADNGGSTFVPLIVDAPRLLRTKITQTTIVCDIEQTGKSQSIPWVLKSNWTKNLRLCCRQGVGN
jgi:hypothetical protein